MNQERRDNPRLNRELPVWVRRPGHTFSRTHTLDLSDSGLRLEFEGTREGEELHLALQLPDGEWISLVGRTVWSRSCGQIGLAFTELSCQAGVVLRRFCFRAASLQAIA